MTLPKDNVGFGFSSRGRAGLKTKEDRPQRGPDCPLTCELLELSLEWLTDAQQIAKIEAHLTTCAHCRQSAEDQHRAVARLNEAREVAGETISFGTAAEQRLRQVSQQQPAQSADVEDLDTVAKLREHGDLPGASSLLLRIANVHPRLRIERARQDREDGDFESARRKLEDLLRPSEHLAIDEQIDCLNGLAWLARRSFDPWLGDQSSSEPATQEDTLAAVERHLDQAEQAAANLEQTYRKELSETRHQRAVVKMLRAGALRKDNRQCPDEKSLDEANRLLDEAHRLIDWSLHVREEVDQPDRLNVARSLIVKGGIFRRQDKFAEAMRAYEDALAIRVAAFGGDNHADVADVLCYIADLYSKSLGKNDEAKKIYQRARDTFKRSTLTELGRCVAARCHMRLAQLMEEMGRPEADIRAVANDGLQQTGRLPTLAPNTHAKLINLAS